jgi:nucleoid DNA-binding protein
MSSFTKNDLINAVYNGTHHKYPHVQLQQVQHMVGVMLATVAGWLTNPNADVELRTIGTFRRITSRRKVNIGIKDGKTNIVDREISKIKFKQSARIKSLASKIAKCALASPTKS